MTDAERLEHARTVIAYMAAPIGKTGETLRWLLERAEAAQRCEELADTYEKAMIELDEAVNDGRCPAHEQHDAGLIRALTSDVVRQMREALGTADTD